jgi:hypothetical protein
MTFPELPASYTRKVGPENWSDLEDKWTKYLSGVRESGDHERADRIAQLYNKLKEQQNGRKLSRNGNGR